MAVVEVPLPHGYAGKLVMRSIATRESISAREYYVS